MPWATNCKQIQNVEFVVLAAAVMNSYISVRRRATDVAEKHVASIIRVGEYRQENSMKQVAREKLYSETVVDIHTAAGGYIPEDISLHCLHSALPTWRM
jgi:hypothetical protein